MIHVKICGIQGTEDALVSAEAGADFIGLVFVPNRRRRLEIDAVARIVASLRSAHPDAPEAVGLFADQPEDEVFRAIEVCQLDLVQLCGRESVEYCGRTAAQTGVEIIKVLHVPAAASIRGADGGGSKAVGDLEGQMVRYRQAGCRITLDRLVEGLQGGTGQSFDWDVAGRLSQKGCQFLLAGGLTPDNVAQAVRQAHPWGVDVSSGVETDGRKDPEKIRSFIRNARCQA